MEEFELKGENGIITIQIKEIFGFPNETSLMGGYDCAVRIEIGVGSYLVKSSFYTSTGEPFKFYKKLKKCHDELNGIAEFDSYESNLELNIKYELGKILIRGKYQENLGVENILEFDFYSNQSYFKYSLDQLVQICNKYGGMKGINN